MDLANIDYTFDSGYLLLTSNNKTTFNISENSSLVTGLYVCAINVANGNLVYEAKEEDKIVNVTISNGLLVTVCADATSSRNSFGKIVNWNTKSYTLHSRYASLPF